jgi:hypothetical protein
VEYLPSKYEALSSNPSTGKKKKKDELKLFFQFTFFDSEYQEKNQNRTKKQTKFQLTK